MIKPNWDIFKAKFSENPQNNFEWFCYLLFSKEFDKPLGIFRYKNQAGIETNPISKDKEIIGFQAKFYDSTLSGHKAELIETIEKSKKYHPDITKVIFYTNQEWGQGKKKVDSETDNDSEVKKEVDKTASDKGIEIEWRCASYFESFFVCTENKIIAKHFFNFEKNIIDLIELQVQHSENILNSIQTNIYFNKKSIEIERNDVLLELIKSKDNVLILSGTGGSGKTAVIKNLYEKSKEDSAFYIFKASEFQLRNINELIPHGTLIDFIDAHNDISKKIIIIDSAEALLNLNNTDPFKEFLAVLLEKNWKIIFTTRDSYLENLNSDFFEIYNINPSNIRIENLTLIELQQLAEENNFVLPKDEKISNLIINPFHLNQYLKFYNPDEQLNILEFKNKLWNQVIKNNKPAREKCFLQLALKRANEGQFFIQLDFDSQVLDDELKKDEIIGYETAGYFITHDIYEEWALEKIIESEFIKKANNQAFLNNIGESLPIRRSFRKWLSEKLFLEREQIKLFIEEIIDDENIASFWQDEVLISILLSDYSENFFEIFDRELLKNDFSLLIKMSFLLRVTCKEVDTDFFKNLTTQNLDIFSLKYVLTKPKGQGWNSLIKYIFKNLNEIGFKNIDFILPIIHDWNSKFKQGESTRLSSLIALKYYQWIVNKDIYLSRDKYKKQILQAIVYGSSEIKTELKEVFDNVVKNNWKQHKSPYQDLSKMILTTLDGGIVAKALPQSVLQLADLFWTASQKETNYFSYSREVESDFGLVGDHDLKYFPSSAYQTPIYCLLNSSLKETIDFVLVFTNKAVEFYSKHPKYEDIKKVVLSISNDVTVTQYHSNSLWCIYRGTSSPVAPYLMQSIHMALEKFLLETFKNIEQEIIEFWLIYLLENSKSSSISAVVTSIVLAYPNKTFNIATILFKTKDFLVSDLVRKTLERQAKSLYFVGYGRNYNHKFFEDERIKTCDDKHRSWDLENLFLQYQCVRNEDISEKEANNRKSILWKILDNYYKESPQDKELDKTWRLCLARMDIRKMNVTTQTTDKGIEIHFNPEIEPELKKYSDDASQTYSEQMKYIELGLWASYRVENNEKHKEYEKYENNPTFAIEQLKEIISEGMENIFNRTIPENVCAVLVRDYFDKISKEETMFCKDELLKYASRFLQKNYHYQMGDGTQPAFSVLSILLQKFSDEKNNIKLLLLFGLFNKYSVDMWGSTRFNIFSIIEINKLWQSNFDDAQSILLCYLLLSPIYIETLKKVQQEKYTKRIYEVHEEDIIERLYQENENILQKFTDNKLLLSDLGGIDEIPLSNLAVAFQLIQNGTKNPEHKYLAKEIIKVFSSKLFLNNRDDRVDYEIRNSFTEKLSYFTLSCEFKEIQEYLNPILDNFENSEEMADLFKEIIYTEDRINSYENFWKIWDLFKPKIIDINNVNNVNNVNNGYYNKVLKSYLFSQCSWKETAFEWRSFKEKDKRFFKEITTTTGYHPEVLYAIAKLLNGIGNCYLNDGIAWISTMLINNKSLYEAKLEDDTIYHLEHISKKYIYKKREDIKKTKKLKQEVLVILDFLIKKGSVVGYMLRENIL